MPIRNYSISIVPGGLLIDNTANPFNFVHNPPANLLQELASNGYQSAVMKSVISTALRAIIWS